jgi:hypothetical protein
VVWAATGPDLVEAVRDWVLAIGLARAAESAAVIGLALVEAVRDWVLVIGLARAAESAAVIGPASADLGLGMVIGLGLAIIGLALVVIVPASVDPGLGMVIGLDSRAVRDQGVAGAESSGPVAEIGPDGLAIGQGPEGVGNGGPGPVIAQVGLAIGLDSRAGMAASPAATGPDGRAIVRETDRAISVPAISGKSAITLASSTGPITAGTLTTTSEVAGEAAGVAATGG